MIGSSLQGDPLACNRQVVRGAPEISAGALLEVPTALERMPCDEVRDIPSRRAIALIDEPAGELFEQDPVISEYMLHVWRRFGLQAQFDLKAGRSRWAFVFWFILDYPARKAQDEVPLPSGLVAHLNAIVYDLHLHGGGTPSDYHRQPISRLMLYLWNNAYRRASDIFSSEGYARFLDWFVKSAVLAGHLDPRLIPAEVKHMMCAPRFISSRHVLPTCYALDALGIHQLGPEYESRSRSPAEFTQTLTELLPVALHHRVLDCIAPPVVRWWERLLGTDGSGGDLRVQTEALSRLVLADQGPPHARGTASANPPTEEQGVHVIGPLAAVSGLGNALRASVNSLAAADVPLKLSGFSLDKRFESPNLDLIGGIQAFRTTEKCRASLIHVNLENIPDVVVRYGSRYPAADYAICYTFWEIDEFIPAHYLGSRCVDEIWVSSEFVRNLYADKLDIPVLNMGIAVEVPELRSPIGKGGLGYSEDTFLFFYSYDSNSSIERKNPIAAIHAFKRAFPKGDEKVGLLLKTKNGGSGFEVAGRIEHIMEEVRSDPRIRYMDQAMTRADYYGLLDASDCYVSLHRAEGFGYGPAEAMLLGKPVIATDYSANCDFTTTETAFVVDYRLKRILKDEYYYQADGAYWADPDIEHAAHYMRRILANRDEARVKAARGQALVAERYSTAAVGGRYAARLAALGLIQDARE